MASEERKAVQIGTDFVNRVRFDRRQLLGLVGGTLAAPTLWGTGVNAGSQTGAGPGARATDRFVMPDEAEPHARTFMQWPVSQQVHPDPQFLQMLQQSIADIANTIAAFEPVVMLMDRPHARAARRLLSAEVDIWDIPTDDLWCRDSGPVFVRNAVDGALGALSFNFNGWGNRQTHDNDGQVARRLAARLQIPLIDSGLVGEGGGVETDGHGTLLAHASCWAHDNRNPEPRDVIEQRLLAALGGRKMIWAPGVKNLDITDYHVDALARFVGPGQVLIQLPERPDPADPITMAAYQTHEILRNATDAVGRPLTVTVIPDPWDTRVTAPDFVGSYVNYYVCNGAVIAAQFGDRDTDAEAVRTLRGLYPGREVVTLNVDPIGETGGGIHCATQQQPKV